MFIVMRVPVLAHVCVLVCQMRNHRIVTSIHSVLTPLWHTTSAHIMSDYSTTQSDNVILNTAQQIMLPHLHQHARDWITTPGCTCTHVRILVQQHGVHIEFPTANHTFSVSRLEVARCHLHASPTCCQVGNAPCCGVGTACY